MQICFRFDSFLQRLTKCDLRKYIVSMNKRYEHTDLPVKDSKVMAHLLGLGLDGSDGHKRITQAEKFSIMGGSEQTHDKMTETLIKTVEDLSIKGKSLEEASMEEVSDLIRKNTPKTIFNCLLFRATSRPT